MVQDYSLIVIEQEKVPLAAAPVMTNGPSWVVLAVMLAVAIVACICIWRYLTQCLVYRQRIRELDPGGGAYRGWNIWRLEQTTEELELDTVWVFEI